MKDLKNVILEKLKIGKSTLNKDNEIKIDFDHSGDFKGEKLDMMFSNDDLENIIDFAENLEISPIKISNKYRNRAYARYIILYYGSEEEATRIIICHESSERYNVIIMVNGVTKYDNHAETIEELLTLLKSGIKEIKFFNMI